ncbi:aminopeptidase [Saccharococcus caldoxylosilyticus]|uniref:Aminopeptidase S (Leu, Val, Phe, Tyr preference) n=1 Tax=Saccharococcus caldoxylosilyticus TaxID=81408 RepID=A0A150L5E9_9BACL|nr:aminopeptidase [Parageobacillus caldoxylosilyticus]KYD07527.1 Aminopeptidase S (Leu, Val, Phe, Tyr preference) [Parageobacillus caldoxylosilyticus]
MSNREQNLEKYAALAVQVGVNVQKGQTLFVNAPLEAAPLVRQIAKKAYEVGAKHVYVEWYDEDLTYIKFKYAPDEAFLEYPMWRAKGMEQLVEEGAAFLSIYSPNPDLLKDVDPTRIATANKTASKALNNYRSALMADQNCWSLISVPTPAWAKKIFPDLSEEEAIDKLWEAIFRITRVDQDNPIQAWQQHNDQLAKIVDYLNEKQYKQLIYEAPGTNLTIELVENHVWHGGAAVSQKGVRFNPNIPTEEVFTMPHKDGVNGKVRNTKPLNYNGNLIDGFTLTFKDGKVVDFTAEKGYETLKHLLDTDEGARRLGEVALVPHQSPISMSNLIFYNTLFDENAACHLALGKAYPTNIQNGTTMSKEELDKHGVNDSLIHEDFMIGSAELNIDGVTKDGKREPIFRNGNWAFEWK